MGLYLVLPDLNQLGLKVDKNLEFSISSKNKENQNFISGLIKELYSTDKISQYGATYFGGFDRYSIEKDWRESAGTVLFIGVFLSVIFLLATVLVIYYKQISEGYEDQARFDIMQKVGMTKREIKKSINSQLLTVFFLPLVGAGIHLIFAFPMIRKILLLFNLTNLHLYTIVTLISFGAFALFYTIVYRITSNAYYHLSLIHI